MFACEREDGNLCRARRFEGCRACRRGAARGEHVIDEKHVEVHHVAAAFKCAFQVLRPLFFGKADLRSGRSRPYQHVRTYQRRRQLFAQELRLIEAAHSLAPPMDRHRKDQVNVQEPTIFRSFPQEPSHPVGKGRCPLVFQLLHRLCNEPGVVEYGAGRIEGRFHRVHERLVPLKMRVADAADRIWTECAAYGALGGIDRIENVREHGRTECTTDVQLCGMGLKSGKRIGIWYVDCSIGSEPKCLNRLFASR